MEQLDLLTIRDRLMASATNAGCCAVGVRFFGISGNILTLTHGAAVTLGASVTTADLPPTRVLPPEANYCDECNWCEQVCPTSFMSRTDFTTVMLREHGQHKYSTREHHMRCASHMMGMTGLSEDGTIESMPLEDARAFPRLSPRSSGSGRLADLLGHAYGGAGNYFAMWIVSSEPDPAF